MADGYWNRQAPIRASASASAMADDYWNQQPPLNPAAAFLPKRPRPDYDLPVGAPSGHELHNYLTRVDDHTRSHSLKDTNYVGVSYDCYLQNSKLSSFGAAEAISNFGGTGLGRGVGGTPGLSTGSLLG